jgi:hypothetical protein
MSDMKPRRGPRELTPIEPSPPKMAGEAVAGEPVPIVPPEATAVPEPVAAIAAAVPEPAPPAAEAPAPAPGDKLGAADSWVAIAEAQAALARGFEQFAVEITGMTRTGMVAGNSAALALLAARTVAEAVEINAGLARRGVDAMIEGSARLSEIGAKTMTDASRPLLSRLGTAWPGGFAA